MFFLSSLFSSFADIFPRLFFFQIFLEYSDQVENFIGSDPCPNCLQVYKQRTLPIESAILVSCTFQTKPPHTETSVRWIN